MVPIRPASLKQAACTALMFVLVAVCVFPALASDAEEALALLSSPVTADETLGSMVGLWKGNGILRQGPRAREEAVRCRLTNRWSEGQLLLKMQLACIGNDYRFTATGHIGQADETYRGAWSTTLGDTAQAVGSRSETGLELSFEGTDIRGREQRSSLSIVIDGRAMSNQFVRIDRETGVPYDALQVVLRR